jgi:hypothetical protein
MPETPDPGEAKKQLEALLGHEIDIDITPEQAAVFEFPIGAHDTTNGVVRSRLIFPPTKICTPSTLLDASGATTTGGATLRPTSRFTGVAAWSCIQSGQRHDRGLDKF